MDEDEITLPGAPDGGDVYIRTRVGVPRHSGCTPVGTLACRNRGMVFQPIRVRTLNSRIEFGEPQVTITGAHTVKVVITMIQWVVVEVYQKMYRRIDCCCEFMGARFDCWTELEYAGDTPKDTVEEPTILPPIEHTSRDWTEWTIDLFCDLAKRAAESAGTSFGGAAGGAVGDAVGDALKDALEPILDEAKRKAREAAADLGFGDGDSSDDGDGQ